MEVDFSQPPKNISPTMPVISPSNNHDPTEAMAIMRERMALMDEYHGMQAMGKVLEKIQAHNETTDTKTKEWLDIFGKWHDKIKE